jgi:hypothetical protein
MEMQKYLNPGPGYKLHQFTKPGTGPLELISTYKGLHLSQQVEICSISPNTVDICVSQHPEWVNSGKAVTLDHPNFTRPLTAHVKAVNWKSSTAVLVGLVESDHRWKLRSNDRIQPGEPLRIEMTARRKTTTAYLNNISQSGIGLIVNHLTTQMLHLEPGALIYLELFLPNQPTPLDLKGIVSRTSALNKMLIYSIGVSIRPTPKQAVLLNQYIEMRRNSLFEELHRISAFVFEPISTKDLFF